MATLEGLAAVEHDSHVEGVLNCIEYGLINGGSNCAGR